MDLLQNNIPNSKIFAEHLSQSFNLIFVSKNFIRFWEINLIVALIVFVQSATGEAQPGFQDSNFFINPYIMLIVYYLFWLLLLFKKASLQYWESTVQQIYPIIILLLMPSIFVCSTIVFLWATIVTFMGGAPIGVIGCGIAIIIYYFGLLVITLLTLRDPNKKILPSA